VNPFLINQQEKNGGTRNRTTEQQDTAKTSPFQSKENRRSMSNTTATRVTETKEKPAKKKKKSLKLNGKEVEGGEAGGSRNRT
jgi:hypothetical protein